MLAQNLDLGFKPAMPGVLKTLQKADIDHYNREGFVQPFDVFGPDEIATIRAYIDDAMQKMGENGAYGINCYQARLASLWDIANDPRILDCVEDIIGPNIVCWASAILSKRPFDPKRVPWHQDASFWGLSPARTVTVWLAIDDVDEANSAMQFIPKTHCKGAIPIRKSEGESVFHIETDGAEALGTPFTNALKAGQISLHADMLVHGSQPNTSSRRRCGLTLRYCPTDVRIVDEDWAKGVEGIICRGEDVSGHWRHHPRPENDDILATASPHVVGNN